MVARFIELKAFVKFLEDTLGFAFDVDRFDHRIMLQKYVFIAKSLGWDNDYPYNIYLRGPYSPDLAQDYYNLATIPVPSEMFERCLVNLEKERFVQIIQNRDIEWLEIGTTILSLYNSNKDRIEKDEIAPFLLERTKDIKSDFDGSYIEDVFGSLLESKLIPK